jgi:hypothetical protein
MYIFCHQGLIFDQCTDKKKPLVKIKYFCTFLWKKKKITTYKNGGFMRRSNKKSSKSKKVVQVDKNKLPLRALHPHLVFVHLQKCNNEKNGTTCILIKL